MLDMKWVQNHPEFLDQALIRRGLSPCAQEILERDTERRQAVTHLQGLQNQRNQRSQEIGIAKASGNIQAAESALAEVTVLKEQIKQEEARLRQLSHSFEELLLGLPNIPLEDVPVGKDETENMLLHAWGTPPHFAFSPKEHDALGLALGMMDFKQAAVLSGSRFTILTGALAALERALGQFMIDLHTRTHAYTEVSPPLLVQSAALVGTAQLPKFAEEQFQTTDGRWLIPTAEVSLTNLVREQIVDPHLLPLRLTALTPCFRSEVGSAGRDVGGMIRQHQFWKCELVSLTMPEDSLEELERMRNCAEAVLQALELPYRVVTLCTGDMGFSARKTYDLEVWLPGQGRYREISSCSFCGDFQARRMQARTRDAEGKTLHLHTLNGSGVAVGRALIAVLENYQNADGTICVPTVLQSYLGGRTQIVPEQRGLYAHSRHQ